MGGEVWKVQEPMIVMVRQNLGMKSVHVGGKFEGIFREYYCDI